MKRIWCVFLAVAAVLAPLAVVGQEEEPEGPAPNKRVFGKSEEASYEGQAVILEIGKFDLMNRQSFKFMRRTLNRAQDEGAKAVVFTLNTPGGYADDTKNLMRAMADSEVPVFAFIDPEAGSAGALISAASNGIYMAPSSLVGAAAIVDGSGMEMEEYMRKKVESFFGAHVRSIAERQGHNPDVIEAMMFVSEEDRTFGTVTVKAGEILTLSAEEAVQEVDGKPLFAKAIVKDVNELLELEGLGGVPVVRADQTAFERIAWWVKLLSPLLIVIGMGAAYAEMKVPGFGIAGLISLTAFAIFFFGNFVAGNLAGYELAAVFVVGLLLIAVEIFLIPGTGIAGFVGVILVVGALLAGMIDEVDFEDFSNEGFSGGEFLRLLRTPAISLAIGLTGGILLAAVLMRFLGSIPGVKWLSLNEAIPAGASLDDQGEESASRIGWTGVATTDLRPAGKAEFDGEVLDVVADGAFVAKGEPVRVTEEEGMRIEVRKA